MRALRTLTILLVVSVSLVLLSPTVSADEGDIVVLSEEVTSQFPGGISFNISLKSSSPINEVRVFYRSEKTAAAAYGLLAFEPGQQVEAQYTLRAGSGSQAGSGPFVPAGATFRYHFEVRNKAGDVLLTKPQQFVYLDPRFEWMTISEGPVTVYHYGPTEKRAQDMLQAALHAVTKMSKILGVDEVEPINIVAYNNYRHMIPALPPRPQAVAEELVNQGQAFTNFRVLVVLAFDEGVQGITSHEVTHVVVDDAAGRAYGILPVWLNEGLAEVGDIAPDESSDNALLYAAYTRRLRPLWYLQTFSGEPDDVIIAYGQGRSVIAYLINTYGEEKIARLMKELSNTLSVDRALMRAYGFDQRGLDREWRLSIGLRPLPEEGESEGPQPAPPALESTPESVVPPTPAPQEKESTRKASRSSCNRSPGPAANVPADALVLLLLAGPISLASWRRFRGPRA